MPFSIPGLSPELLELIRKEGFEKPYPIQEQAVPAILAGKDVLGIAATGSGKTAGFVFPILERLQQDKKKNNRHIRVLVLVPTRELAVQVGEVFQQFSKAFKPASKTLAVFGGVSINPQMMKLQGTDIVVATPGRLLDLIESNALHLSEVETLVLDEADKMLNLGFKDEITAIFKLLPVRRQNILFSATLDKEVNGIHEILLRDPLTIEIVPEALNIDLIEQSAYLVTEEKKGPFLRYLVKSMELEQVLVFTSSVRTADNLVMKLKKNGIDASALHSGKSQGSRTDSLVKFKNKKLRVLVATDIAARGIDIPELPVVINFELPRSPKDYVHRIGRTGRAEASGKAISLVTAAEEPHFYIIQKKMGKRVKLIPTEDIGLHGY
ncbi:MAG: DEAD/DEAH box helicase [Bacteroidota bacterium]